MKLPNSKQLLLLVVGVVLISLGIFKPNLSIPVQSTDTLLPSVELQEKCQPLVSIFRKSDSPDKKKDAQELAKLYSDLSKLIALDNDDTIIKNTEEIREANKLSGKMLNLGLKDKYENLAETCDDIVKSYIGDENIVLSSELRKRSSEVFDALSWALKEGTK